MVSLILIARACFPASISVHFAFIVIVVGFDVTEQDGMLAKTVAIKADARVENSPRNWLCST